MNVSERAAASPQIAVSTVIFSLRRARPDDGRAGSESRSGEGLRLWIPLVRRTRQPYRGQWALPGGPLLPQQSLQEAAAEHLRSTTGLVPRYLEQLYTFGGVDRSPAQRVVTIAYWALVRDADADPAGGANSTLVDDPHVSWFPADSEEAARNLAFDHSQIVAYALERLRNKVAYGKIAHRLLGDRFTLAQIHEVHQAILGRPLDPANFRRQLRGSPDLVDTGEYLQGVKHRPPKLYRYADPDGEAPPAEPSPAPAPAPPAPPAAPAPGSPAAAGQEPATASSSTASSAIASKVQS
ncbi:NUDIX domain-containing protein [Zhihengliuella sp.]|uniref:NUDIX hydrolase n=1 Tax=Zhihengliuella sp. TaxID=1954483 RepID=UPI0028123AB9|nr:NUDIX domain-containing protein [Zhihengliuella sp.]